MRVPAPRVMREDSSLENITTAPEVASTAVVMLLFAGLGALWNKFVVGRSMPRASESRLVRWWSWGIVWVLVVVGVIALLIAAYMGVTGTTVKA